MTASEQAVASGPSAGPAPRRIYRSRTERVVCGFCGGLAEYLGVDPVLVRLGFVGLFLASPAAAFILYIAACVVTPERPRELEAGAAGGQVRVEWRRLALLSLGGALVLAGAFALGWSLMGGSLLETIKRLSEALKMPAGAVGGLVLIGVGVALLAAASRAGPESGREAQG